MTPPHNQPTLVIDNTHRVVAVPLDYDRSPEPDDQDWAMPAARAATSTGPSLLRVSGIAGISIAVFAAFYFVAQIMRGVL